jgi:uncharacterized protein YerC
VHQDSSKDSLDTPDTPATAADTPGDVEFDALSDWKTESEIEERRLHVARMRMQRISQRDIAARLGCTQATVSRDLAWIRDQSDDYFRQSKRMLARKLGWLMMRLELYEAELFKLSRMRGGPPMTMVVAVKEAKQTCLEQLWTYQDFGMIERYLGSLNLSGSGVPSALDVQRIAMALGKRPLFTGNEPALQMPTPDECSIIDIPPKKG